MGMYSEVEVKNENVSEAICNVIDLIEALKRDDLVDYDGDVLKAPLDSTIEMDDEDPSYSIGDCLEDIKSFIESIHEQIDWESEQ